jgi:hypothetical protein
VKKREKSGKRGTGHIINPYNTNKNLIRLHHYNPSGVSWTCLAKCMGHEKIKNYADRIKQTTSVMKHI